MARTTCTRMPKLSQRFVTFVLGPNGQKILKTLGLPPQAGGNDRRRPVNASPAFAE